jgi:hypothetical protein
MYKSSKVPLREKKIGRVKNNVTETLHHLEDS